MSRPVFSTVNIGSQGWGPVFSDNVEQVYNTPYPVPRHTGDESTLETAFPAVVYDECIVWVNHSIIGWTLYYATDGVWSPLAQPQTQGLSRWEFSDFFGFTDETGGAQVGAVPPFAAAQLLGGRAQATALSGMQGSLRLLTAVSPSANSGYRFMTPNVSSGITEAGTAFFGIFAMANAVTDRTVRLGFMDTIDHTDAVDGIYFEVSAGTMKAKTASNSTRTTSATFVPVHSTVYACRIVATTTASARFSVWDWVTPGAYLLDVTITTNIPTTTARAFGAGLIATKDDTTGANVAWVDYLGFGTRLPAAFAR